jgi:hypothetical protein
MHERSFQYSQKTLTDTQDPHISLDNEKGFSGISDFHVEMVNDGLIHSDLNLHL